jgi:hypothetical protein
MYINTRRHSGVVRVGLVKFIFVAACLFLCRSVFAQHASAPAEHDYLVNRCVERAASATSETSFAAASARCEEWQRQIDAVYGTFRLGNSWKIEEPCVNGASTCKPDKISIAQVDSDHGRIDSSRDRVGFGHVFDKGRFLSPKNCIGVGCMSDIPPITSQYDAYEVQQRFRDSSINGSDYFADLIYPGFGRLERRRQDADIRLDFLNPRRCGRYQRVGLCLSMTMH